MNQAANHNNSARFAFTIIISLVVLVALAIANLLIGSVAIPFDAICNIIMGQDVDNRAWSLIITQSRLPLIATAMLAGAGLAIVGLILQTVFNNPLADPSILGVSTGASLGVAMIMLLFSGYFGSLFASTFGGYFATLLGALIGAMIVLAILLFFSTLVKSATMLLIIGIMVSYLASSAISFLNFFATQEGVHSFVIWGLGNFSGVSPAPLPFFATTVIIGVIWAAAMAKQLNALLLGNRYAENLGVNIRNTRNILLVISGIITAVVTAFCGPIGFLGLVIPHIARLLLCSSSHPRLIPACVLIGADVALFCSLISVLPTSIGIIPINAITPIIGVPIILYIIINRRKIQYFN